MWQHAAREEEIPEVGDFVTYDIVDDTVSIIRSATGDIRQWQPVLIQDFDNMTEVPRGMRSRGFRGCIPSPRQE